MWAGWLFCDLTQISNPAGDKEGLYARRGVNRKKIITLSSSASPSAVPWHPCHESWDGMEPRRDAWHCHRFNNAASIGWHFNNDEIKLTHMKVGGSVKARIHKPSLNRVGQLLGIGDYCISLLFNFTSLKTNQWKSANSRSKSNHWFNLLVWLLLKIGG